MSVEYELWFCGRRVSLRTHEPHQLLEGIRSARARSIVAEAEGDDGYHSTLIDQDLLDAHHAQHQAKWDSLVEAEGKAAKAEGRDPKQVFEPSLTNDEAHHLAHEIKFSAGKLADHSWEILEYIDGKPSSLYKHVDDGVHTNHPKPFPKGPDGHTCEYDRRCEAARLARVGAKKKKGA